MSVGRSDESVHGASTDQWEHWSVDTAGLSDRRPAAWVEGRVEDRFHTAFVDRSCSLTMRAAVGDSSAAVCLLMLCRMGPTTALVHTAELGSC